MKKQTIATAALGLVAFGSIGLNIFQAQSAAGMDQNYKAQTAKIEDLKGKLKDTQAIYNGAKLQNARQFHELMILSSSAPEAFNAAVASMESKTDDELLNQFNHVGVVPKESAKKTATTNTAATATNPTKESATDNTGNTTPESATKTASSNAATTATIPSYTGLTEEQFTALLKTAGFTNITVSHQSTPGSPAGYVFGCYPNTGSDEPFNKEIQIQVTQ